MKIRIKFSKQGNMRFIGHLDIMRYFQKAMRRADVDIRYSEGFSPHQIMSFAAPLGVGLTGSGEYLDIDVLSTDSSQEMVRRLNAVMVEGMEVLSFKKLPDSAANAMSLVAACDYTIRLRADYENGFGMTAEEFFSRADEFLKTGDLNIIKKTKKGEKAVDLAPLIYVHRLTEDREGLFLRLSSGSTANIKPELVLETACNGLGLSWPQFAFRINREEVYADRESALPADSGVPENPGEGPDPDAERFIPLEVFGEDIE